MFGWSEFGRALEPNCLFPWWSACVGIIWQQGWLMTPGVSRQLAGVVCGGCCVVAGSWKEVDSSWIVRLQESGSPFWCDWRLYIYYKSIINSFLHCPAFCIQMNMRQSFSTSERLIHHTSMGFNPL